MLALEKERKGVGEGGRSQRHREMVREAKALHNQEKSSTVQSLSRMNKSGSPIAQKERERKEEMRRKRGRGRREE